ncbi:alpha/beta fold hydrolase [Rhodococcus sp. BP-349]|uniref:alpha/beta hydrolase n=1 Tax=unclassified Rhodococcus (in: high G+C Gram-positive bacteria) TaxID=192944 RepID=UPI001C9B408F|nr:MULTISPECIES: alpha/beta fold hydrolase [unclassified Rhodococcus (in: high G+C Gram-positive bacteria)]MBY6539891.1 alpha/beta fold hydrolase [Rhodococcus sp. BP-363]MBY6543781.1 alpha/beta fold hydrolase [Rhodococcus sp. BP-369]MBY6563011.1 alpha/beta fold hydrolase [Rhodococcus sp. BP-370]MBY6577303.1 alpha/beta fold hydrolase [Rhodococcus sp. BP-364]MBY6586604.1 alpha/beta fold hydrolase [Rhodococcus sp. BP-358]
MPFFEGPRGRAHYRQWAPTADPAATLVFLHGRGQHSGQYHRFGAALAQHGIATWGLDHIGHGLSEGEVADDAAYLDALAENARHLLDILAEAGHSPAVMGHSLGSATAVRMLAAGASAPAVVLVAMPPRAIVREDLVLATASPTLALHGVDDRMVPIDGVRDLVRGIPTITLREYADAGHDLVHEKVHRTVTDAAADHVLAFA